MGGLAWVLSNLSRAAKRTPMRAKNLRAGGGGRIPGGEMSARYLKFCASTILVGMILLLPRFAAGADSAEEDQLIGVLQSDESLQKKDEACARLKWIGTDRSVTVLAQLLSNGDLSHSA